MLICPGSFPLIRSRPWARKCAAVESLDAVQSSSADQTGPAAPNPLLALPFVPALEALGPESWDVVEPATFPRATLHFRTTTCCASSALTTLRWPMPTPSRPTAAL